MSLIDLKNLRIDDVSALYHHHPEVHVLRLDLIHPVISGNKWFKLKEYISDAKNLNKNIIVTFGGAWSNHILATAAAGKTMGLKTVGIIRGEKSRELSQTLRDAMEFGMELFFLSRENYSKKILPEDLLKQYSMNEIYVINEGGVGGLGGQGASQILDQIDTSSYTHFIAATGTGTTIAGITVKAQPEQQVIGISVLKNNVSVKNEIEKMTGDKKNFLIIHDYHFGGYAKKTSELIAFMNQFYIDTDIPSDFVYTGKLLFATDDLIRKNEFKSTDKLLLIHSGGLQGNNSLPKGTLIF